MHFFAKSICKCRTKSSFIMDKSTWKVILNCFTCHILAFSKILKKIHEGLFLENMASNDYDCRFRKEGSLPYSWWFSISTVLVTLGDLYFILSCLWRSEVSYWIGKFGKNNQTSWLNSVLPFLPRYGGWSLKSFLLLCSSTHLALLGQSHALCGSLQSSGAFNQQMSLPNSRQS